MEVERNLRMILGVEFSCSRSQNILTEEKIQAKSKKHQAVRKQIELNVGRSHSILVYFRERESVIVH